MVKKKGGHLVKAKREQLLNDLRILFKSGDIRYYSIRDLSVKFDIAKDTVSKYLDEVAREVPPKEIEHIRIKFKEMFEDAIETCKALLDMSRDNANNLIPDSAKEVRENIKLLMATIKEYTDFMERFFIKEKAQENVNLQADITQRSLNVEVIINGESTNP